MLWRRHYFLRTKINLSKIKALATPVALVNLWVTLTGSRTAFPMVDLIGPERLDCTDNLSSSVHSHERTALKVDRADSPDAARVRTLFFSRHSGPHAFHPVT
jgi:hypothetical protein